MSLPVKMTRLELHRALYSNLYSRYVCECSVKKVFVLEVRRILHKTMRGWLLGIMTDYG